MPVIVYKSDELCRLERTIKDGTKVFLIDIQDADIINLLLSKIRNDKLEKMEVWHCLDSIEDDKGSVHLSSEAMRDILEICQMYDFSDKVDVIADSSQYASMLNYVKTGILSKEEMIEALLYKT